MTENKLFRSKDELNEFTAFVKEFYKEKDRAAVILGVAKIDAQLYQVLQKFLCPCPSSKDELLDGDGPLSTFQFQNSLGLSLRFDR